MDGVIKDIGKQFGLETYDKSPQFDHVAKSPSYAEISMPVSSTRIARWKNYHSLLAGRELEVFDRLPASYGYGV